MHMIYKKENGTKCWSVSLMGKDHLKEPIIIRGYTEIYFKDTGHDRLILFRTGSDVGT